MASYSQLEYRIHRLAQGTGRADPSYMEELTFQQRGDMATGILRELDPLGETLEKLFSLFLLEIMVTIPFGNECPSRYHHKGMGIIPEARSKYLRK